MEISFKVLSSLILYFLYSAGFIVGSSTSDFHLIVKKFAHENNITTVVPVAAFGNAPNGFHKNWTTTEVNPKIDRALHEVRGYMIAPPRRPSDYELFPGVGYYKFHPELAKGFEDASSICAKEGGHLAIVNSEAEHQVMAKLFARYPESVLEESWAFVGFHDREKEGEYVTIYGQPLNTTGFTRWTPNNPDNQDGEENCGAVDRNGSLKDVGCSYYLPFICEHDLSWE